MSEPNPKILTRGMLRAKKAKDCSAQKRLTNRFSGTRGFGVCHSEVLSKRDFTSLLADGNKKRPPGQSPKHSNKKRPKTNPDQGESSTLVSGAVLVGAEQGLLYQNQSVGSAAKDPDLSHIASIVENSFSFFTPGDMPTGLTLMEQVSSSPHQEMSIDDSSGLENYLLAARAQSGEDLFKFMDEIKNQVPFTQPKKPETWNERVESLEEAWDEVFEDLLFQYLSRQAFSPTKCFKCPAHLDNYAIRCVSCATHLCFKCDHSQHTKNPFHERSLLGKSKEKSLLPTEFVDGEGNTYIEGVPVPCIAPSCSKCLLASMELKPGTRNISVVTKDGRFELKSTTFFCTTCALEFPASAYDYIASGYWPGNPSNISYLFSTDLLKMWYLIKHNSPSSSENKFIETLEMIPEGAREGQPINKTQFRFASKYCEFFSHQVDEKIKRRNLTECLVCRLGMLASHPDGNFKLMRLSSAKGLTLKSLFGNTVIANDEDVSAHIKLVDSFLLEKSKTSETCGDSVFKAARPNAGKYQKLDETGIMMRTCRHGVVDKAANMFQGETFRHTHFMHLDLPGKKCKFLCNDVVCHYWEFAEKVARHRKEYSPMIREMIPFLSRVHAKLHVFYCQIIWTGHWMTGAALTLGEEQEQTNSKMSRYGSVTKHMGKANRRDHLTTAILFWNAQKHSNMSKHLVQRRKRAIKLSAQYEQQLQKLLDDNNFSPSILPSFYEELIAKAVLCKNEAKQKHGSSLHVDQQKLEGTYSHYQKLKSDVSKRATTSQGRIKIRRAMVVLKKRATNLIESISSQANYKITIEDFESGFFPWYFGGKVSYRDKFQIVDTWMLSKRAKEEILQSETEMQNLLKSILELKSVLQKEKKNYFVLASKQSTPKVENHGHSPIDWVKVNEQCVVIVNREIARLDNLLAEALYNFSDIENVAKTIKEVLQEDSEISGIACDQNGEDELDVNYEDDIDDEYLFDDDEYLFDDDEEEDHEILSLCS